MNQAYQFLLSRRSIRRYEEKQISEQELSAVLEAGLYAPTARDNQKPLMVVVQNPKDIAALEALNAAELTTTKMDHPFFGAPTLIVVLADPTVKTWVEDGSLVLGNLMNAAEALNLGSCWINRAREVFDREAGKAWLRQWGIPEHYRGVGNCILGYIRGEKPLPHQRKDGRVLRV